MRRRIVGLTVLAAVLTTALFGIPLAVAAARYFIADEHNELEHIADTVALAASGDLMRSRDRAATSALEADTQVSVYDSSGLRLTGTGPATPGPLLGSATQGTVTSGTINGRFAVAVPVSDGDTVVGAVLVTAGHAQVYRRIGEAWLAMFALAAAAVAAAWLLARRQVRRLTGPLDALTLAAERLGAGDFSVRTHPAGIAEIDSVNASLNRTADRLGALVERERTFTADVSHQLRTPLTGLRLGLEAALDDPAADPGPAMRDALVAADRLQATITDLLTLARDIPRAPTALDLDTLLQQIRERWNGVLAAEGRPLRIVQHPPLPPSPLSAPTALHTVDVLIDNARRHGHGAVTITARDAGEVLAIDVANEGPPITRDAQALFVRRSDDATGTGIGLALARSLAESEGARVTLTDPRQPTFTLFTPRRIGSPDVLA